MLGAAATVLPDADQFFEGNFILNGWDEWLELRGQLFLGARGVEYPSWHGAGWLLLRMIAFASALRRSPLWLVLFASSICCILFDKRCLSALKLLSSSTEHCTDLAMRYVNSELDKNYASLRFAY